MPFRMPSAIVPVAAIAALIAAAAPAHAQVGRIQAPPPPPPPGIQQPNLDPSAQAMAALRLRIDALRESVGRQVVVLNFEPLDTTSWADADNSFPKNTQRAEAICKEALGDRYGRVLSRKAEPIMSANRWYFPNLLCETKP